MLESYNVPANTTRRETQWQLFVLQSMVTQLLDTETEENHNDSSGVVQQYNGNQINQRATCNNNNNNIVSLIFALILLTHIALLLLIIVKWGHWKYGAAVFIAVLAFICNHEIRNCKKEKKNTVTSTMNAID